MEQLAEEKPKTLFMNDYSEKAFIVYGETKPYKDAFKKMGGKFNKYLKVESGEDKVPGWVFSRKFQEEVTEFVLNINSGKLPEEMKSDLPSVTNNLPTVSVPRNLGNYQWVNFKVFRPKEGQRVTLTTEEKVSGKTMRSSIEGKVLKVESHNDIVDTVYIKFDEKDSSSLGVICRSKWQIFGYFKDHSLYFLD